MKYLYCLVLLTVASSLRAQHGHLEVGASGRNQNDPLVFHNGADFVGTYVKTLLFASSNRYAGYYEGNITLTVLASTFFDNAPAPGSYIQFGISNISGPPGGAFGFWEVTGDDAAVWLRPGQTSSDLFPLTQSDGSPGSDPFGHIHGRRFTATVPGIYQIAFKAFDTSTNGTDGSPIHTPSEWLPVYFQAGINIANIAQTGSVASVRYGSTGNQVFTLEYCTDLSNWLPAAAAPLVGDEHFQVLEDPAASGPQRFYRVRADPVSP